MFDTTALSISLYGSEITGFENHTMLESLCVQFYMIISNVKKTHHILFCMLRSEGIPFRLK